jgi:hypothetical protein
MSLFRPRPPRTVACAEQKHHPVCIGWLHTLSKKPGKCQCPCHEFAGRRSLDEATKATLDAIRRQ